MTVERFPVGPESPESVAALTGLPAVLEVPGSNGEYSLRLTSFQDEPSLSERVQEDIAHLGKYLFWVHNYNEVTAKNEIANMVTRMEQGEMVAYRIVDASGDILGSVAVFGIKKDSENQERKVASIGWWRFSDVAISGCVRNSTSCLIGLVFSEFDVHKLEADIIPGNVHSERLAERLGMTNTQVKRPFGDPPIKHQVWELVRK